MTNETHFEQSLRGLESRLMGLRETSDQMAGVEAEWLVEPGQADYGEASYAVTDTDGDIKALCFTEGTAAAVAALPALIETLASLADVYRADVPAEHWDEGALAFADETVRAARGEA